MSRDGHTHAQPHHGAVVEQFQVQIRQRVRGVVPGDDVSGRRQGLRLAEHGISRGDGRLEERAGMHHVAEVDQAGHFQFARSRIFGVGPANQADQDILVVGVVVDEPARKGI